MELIAQVSGSSPLVGSLRIVIGKPNAACNVRHRFLRLGPFDPNRG
jgi:hypothetical protein